MPQVYQLTDGIHNNANVTGGAIEVTNNTSNTFFAQAFFAENNYKINRLLFRVSNSTGTFTFTAGIGTWNSSTYLPWTVAGAGRTLEYISHKVYDQAAGVAGSIITPINAFIAASNIADIPEVTLEAGKLYYIGFGVTGASPTTFTLNVAAQQTLANSYTNIRSFRRTGGATNLFGSGLHHQCAMNWGYDSGDGKTEWYNSYYCGFGVSTTAALNMASLRYAGTSLYFNGPFNSYYLDSVKVLIRNSDTSAFPSGTGHTYIVTLFDSDASTALIAHTLTHYQTSNIAANRGAVFPVKYELQNNKLYWLGFRRHVSNVSTNNNLLSTHIDLNCQTGNAFTSQAFVMTTLGSPIPIQDLKLVATYQFNILDGSRQGGIGSISGLDLP